MLDKMVESFAQAAKHSCSVDVLKLHPSWSRLNQHMRGSRKRIYRYGLRVIHCMVLW